MSRESIFDPGEEFASQGIGHGAPVGLTGETMESDSNSDPGEEGA